MKRKPGRPRGKKTTPIRVYASTKKILARFAKSHGVTIADVLSGVQTSSWADVEFVHIRNACQDE